MDTNAQMWAYYQGLILPTEITFIFLGVDALGVEVTPIGNTNIIQDNKLMMKITTIVMAMLHVHHK
jgi:hypothetical protein